MFDFLYVYMFFFFLFQLVMGICWLLKLMPHIIVHAATFSRTVAHIKTFSITIDGLTTISITVPQFFLFSFCGGHFGCMLFSPLCSTILKPNLKCHRKRQSRKNDMKNINNDSLDIKIDLILYWWFAKIIYKQIFAYPKRFTS